MTTDEPIDALSAIRRRLDADGELDTEPGLLVLAAMDGRDALDEVLDGAGSTAPALPPPAGSDEPASVYLTRLSVEGFRGIGAASDLDLTPGPGLTLVAGRNGSGKSSFAEALELLLTGANQRWEKRSAVWKQGWRNLHHRGEARIRAHFAVGGESRPTIVERTWAAEESDLAAGTMRVTHAGTEMLFDELGWVRPIERFRPFLPYNELGAIVEQPPSALYEVLSAVLGLERPAAAVGLLREKINELRKVAREADGTRGALLHDLRESDEERAQECARFLGESPTDLDAVELVLEGARDDGATDRLSLLRELVAITAPAAEAVGESATTLEKAQAVATEMDATDAGRARAIAETLTRVVELHDTHGDQDCPVCGGARLDGEWRTRAEAQVAQLGEQARAAIAAERALTKAREQLIGLFAAPPALLSRLEEIGIGGDTIREAWDAWSTYDAEASTDALARHARERHTALHDAVAVVQKAAEQETNRLEDAWRPLAARLRGALPAVRAGVHAESKLPAMRASLEWLDSATKELREERFRPIAHDAETIWATLQQRGSVVLNEIALQGQTTRRRVDLNVTIDGVEGAALGVMSQGELHSLALALFLPRVMRAETPFQFVVIDDPVQAMDPSRVDGLAHVLQQVAGRRQVVVFTHDDRLPEALRRLQIPAHVIEVGRGEHSVVTARVVRDPVAQYLDDARALALTDDLPPEVARRVIPGFCRHALEAAAIETVRRRRIGRGETHAEVSAILERASTLLSKLALVLFDDESRAGDVMRSLQNRWGRRAADAAGAANRGSHGGMAADWRSLVEDVSRLSESIRTID